MGEGGGDLEEFELYLPVLCINKGLKTLYRIWVKDALAHSLNFNFIYCCHAQGYIKSKFWPHVSLVQFPSWGPYLSSSLVLWGQNMITSPVLVLSQGQIMSDSPELVLSWGQAFIVSLVLVWSWGRDSCKQFRQDCHGELTPPVKKVQFCWTFSHPSISTYEFLPPAENFKKWVE